MKHSAPKHLFNTHILVDFNPQPKKVANPSFRLLKTEDKTEILQQKKNSLTS